MKRTDSVRVATCLVLVVCAFGVSALLLRDCSRAAVSSDAQLLATFSGAAYEDIFGFGFWVTWLFLAAIEASLLLGAWLLVPTRAPRALVAFVLVIFLFSSALNYWAFTREQSLWFSGQRHSQLQANYSFKRTAATGCGTIMPRSAAAA